jgi:putative membrane protein
MKRKEYFRVKRRRKKFRIISLAISIVLMSSIMGLANAEGTYKKNETVYVVLDESGKMVDERVVNSFHGDIKEDIIDYGEYSSLRNMKSENRPEISGNQIKWSKESAEDGSLYFEGITSKELPVNIDIQYFLNGEKKNVHDIVGKDGKVKILIKVINNLKINQTTDYKNFYNKLISKEEEYYVPLLVQISYPADLTIFSDISAEDGINVVTGETMSLNFAAFPYPDAEISFEMKGRNIEINPITFTVIPKLPEIPDFDMEEDITEILDGIVEIRKGIDELRKGSTSIADGGKELDSKSEEFLDGGHELVSGLEELQEHSLAINSGLDASIEGLGELKEGTVSIIAGLKQTNRGMESINNSAKDIVGGIGELKIGSEKLKDASGQVSDGLAKLHEINSGIDSRAKRLVAENLPGSELYNLGMAILTQSEILSLLTPGSDEVYYGLQELDQGIGALKDNLSEGFIPGIQGITEATGQLAVGSQQLLEGMEEYNTGQTELKNGIEKYFDGVKKASEGIKALNDGGIKMFSGFKELVSYQEEISEGLDSLKTKGISKMEKGLVEAVHEIRQGKSKKDNMIELADNYRSFMDNNNNKNSNVQFVMQTKKVKLEKLIEIEKEGKKDKEGFWYRFKKLFGLKTN